jgi:hypothetical protein
MYVCKREMLGIGRRLMSRIGARAMKAKIWWGVLKSLDWGVVLVWSSMDGGWGLTRLNWLEVDIPSAYAVTRNAMTMIDTPMWILMFLKKPAKRTLRGQMTNSARHPITACARFARS